MTGAPIDKKPTTQNWAKHPPFQNHLGIEIIESKDGTSLLRLPARPENTNRKGDVHGGASATLADLAMSQAVRSAADGIAGLSTISMTVNFLDAAQGTVIAKGRVLRVGRTIGVAEATVETEDGRVVVHASGSFRLIRPH
jgi:uncharacterized protein (TIGR00369 family)